MLAANNETTWIYIISCNFMCATYALCRDQTESDQEMNGRQGCCSQLYTSHEPRQQWDLRSLTPLFSSSLFRKAIKLCARYRKDDLFKFAIFILRHFYCISALRQHFDVSGKLRCELVANWKKVSGNVLFLKTFSKIRAVLKIIPTFLLFYLNRTYSGEV